MAGHLKSPLHQNHSISSYSPGITGCAQFLVVTARLPRQSKQGIQEESDPCRSNNSATLIPPNQERATENIP